MNTKEHYKFSGSHFVLVFICVHSWLIMSSCSKPADSNALEHHRNLGKAYYENPTTKEKAVDEFRQAYELNPKSARDKLNYAISQLRVEGREPEAVKLLEEVQKQDPSLPHTWFNLGIYYKRLGQTDRAIREFEGMVERAPDEPIGHLQLGTLYQQAHRVADAEKELKKAAELDPQLAAARFQLYNLERLAGKPDEAKSYLIEFQRLQQLQKSWIVPEDPAWCSYAEIYDPPAARPAYALKVSQYTDIPLPVTVDFATAGLTLIDAAGTGETDLLVWSSKGIQLLLKGQQPAATGFEKLKDVIDVAPGDFDNDGLMDLCVLTTRGPELYRNAGGKFVRQPVKLPERRFDRAVWIDYDHDYDLDLVLPGPEPALLRNQGAAGWEDRTGEFPFIRGDVLAAEKKRVDPDSKAFDLAVSYRDHTPVLYRDLLGGRYKVEALKEPPPAAPVQVFADFDAPGRLDSARIEKDGSVHYLRNQSSYRNWIAVRLKGIRALKLAQDALVEIKAGALYQRALYAGVPLLFDLGDNTAADVVRITWPNGLIQNEVNRPANQTHTIEEAQRLSGSCPMIWTWNGQEFEFITDVLGVAPLGARNGDGSFFPVDHQEYVQIPGRSLGAQNGRYEIRISEELSEVSYLDQVRLLAADHPAGTEIFTNERFKSPPYPDFRLFRVEKKIYPRAARDDRGQDVLAKVTAKDQRYPDGFQRSETGLADLHTLDLDFTGAAPSGQAVLLLNGWVDWPDGSTFRRAAQESQDGFVMPYLQVKDAQGNWQTVDADMGMPAGKPKTIAVPVRFLSASREIRIVTNLCIYWDELFLSEDIGDAGVRPVAAMLESARLRFRGFSASRIDAARQQPDTFFYGRVSPASFWNPTPGLYTKYGDVDELLRDVDDRMVIMGSGDEAQLAFSALPAPRPGYVRDFLLKVDGWAKDRDPNTAFSASVDPLPFHAMSRYPYPAGEHYPRDAAHDRYQRVWNTRLATAQIAPLAQRKPF